MWMVYPEYWMVYPERLLTLSILLCLLFIPNEGGQRVTAGPVVPGLVAGAMGACVFWIGRRDAQVSER
jgi:hypothetical protein